jgi:hypothetical protein
MDQPVFFELVIHCGYHGLCESSIHPGSPPGVVTLSLLVTHRLYAFAPFVFGDLLSPCLLKISHAI